MARRKLNVLPAPVAARRTSDAPSLPRTTRELDPLEPASWPRFVEDDDLDMLADRFSKAARDARERAVFDTVLRRAYDDAAELEILFGEVPGVLAGDRAAEEHFRQTLEEAGARGIGGAPIDPTRGGPRGVPAPFTPDPDPPQGPCRPQFLIQPFVVSAIVQAADRISSGDRGVFSRYVNIIGGLWRQTDHLERFYRQAMEGFSITRRDRLVDTLRLIERDFVRPGVSGGVGRSAGARLDVGARVEAAVGRLDAVSGGLGAAPETGPDGPRAGLSDFTGRNRLPPPGDEPIPLIWPPGPPGGGAPQEPCEIARDACREMVLGGASQLTLPLPTSILGDKISSIRPRMACANETIHILGRGFGRTQPPDVTVLIGGQPARVTRWSDTDIAVEVPRGAGSGCVGFRDEQAERRRRELHEQNQKALEEISEGLSCMRRGAIFHRIKYVPDKVPCTGRNFFEGTAAEIELFNVNNQVAATVRPGTRLVLTWSVRNATTFSIRRTSSEGPPVDLTDPPGQMLNLGAFTGTRATTATYELTATNRCGTVSAKVTVNLRAALQITGMEVTQSIQTVDNRLPLVHGKPTVVRVYFESQDGDWDGVTGRLTVGSSAPLAPMNGPTVQAKAAGSDRRTLADSLLFRLPDGETAPGQRFLLAEIMSAPGAGVADRRALLPTFSDVDMDIHVYGVTMGYENVNLKGQRRFGITSSDWPAKDFSEFEPQGQLCQEVFPVRSVEVRKLPGDPEPAIIDYNDGNGYLEGRAWGQRLIDMAFPHGGERIYVLQPEEERGNNQGNTNPPTSVGNIVMNGWDTPDEIGYTFAHEVAHSWGLGHAGYRPDTMVPLRGLDSSYPYPDGWIGPDVGVHIGASLEIFPGDAVDGSHVTYDLMSYEDEQWISPYSYCKLMSTISGGKLACPAGQQMSSLRIGRSSPLFGARLASSLRSLARSPGIKLLRGKRARQFLYVLGRVHESGTASLDPFEIIPSSEDIASRTRGSTYQLVLEDEAGRAIRSVSFDVAQTESEPRDPTTFFSMFVSYDTPAARIVLRRGDEVLAERRPSANAPTLRLEALPAKTIRGKQTITWEGRDPDGGQLTFSLWYSGDGGETFLPVNASMSRTSAVVDFDHVPPSDQGILRLLASNGVTTTEVRSAPFAVKRRDG